MPKLIVLTVLAILVLTACGPGDSTQSTATTTEIFADTIYTNGRIYTVDEAQPWVEAIAIKDGELIVVGSNADAQAVTGDGTEVIDLAGKFVMPGMHDIHLHIQNAYTADALEGQLLFFPAGVQSIEELAISFASMRRPTRTSRCCSQRTCRTRCFRTTSPPKLLSTPSWTTGRCTC